MVADPAIWGDSSTPARPLVAHDAVQNAGARDRQFGAAGVDLTDENDRVTDSEREVSSPEEAERYGMHSSPTICVDGQAARPSLSAGFTAATKARLAHAFERHTARWV
jgi:hypothetical protein